MYTSNTHAHVHKCLHFAGEHTILKKICCLWKKICLILSTSELLASDVILVESCKNLSAILLQSRDGHQQAAPPEGQLAGLLGTRGGTEWPPGHVWFQTDQTANIHRYWSMCYWSNYSSLSMHLPRYQCPLVSFDVIFYFLGLLASYPSIGSALHFLLSGPTEWRLIQQRAWLWHYVSFTSACCATSGV